MRSGSDGHGTITAAQRGQIVQRVIVDGWTAGRTAAAFDLPERLVAIWVDEYRRHGMASLRRSRSRRVALEVLRLRLLLPIRAGARRVASGVRRLFAHDPPVHPFPFPRSADDRRGGA